MRLELAAGSDCVPYCSWVSQAPSPLSTGGGSSLTRRSPFKNGNSLENVMFPMHLRNGNLNSESE